MSKLIVTGAKMSCSFGAAPSSLSVLPTNTEVCGKPAANIMDFRPMVNILPFGMCSSLANPQVASATAAAMGVLTPQPCIPATSSPWIPGAPTVLIDNQPLLDDKSKCTCNWAGVIQFTDPGQTIMDVP